MRSNHPSTVAELIDRYLAYAERYYQCTDETGKRVPTRQAKNIAGALSHFLAVAGDKHPADILADDLCRLQEYMQLRMKPDGKPYSRDYINKCCTNVRSMFKWAATPPRRWVPTTVLEDMRLATGLKTGRCLAVETQDVPPVPEAHVRMTQMRLATYSYSRRLARHGVMLSRALDILWHSGMRPGELMRMRNDPRMFAVDQVKLLPSQPTTEVLVYSPLMHKTKHHGYDRNIFLSPTCRTQVEQVLKMTRPGEKVFPWTTQSFREALYRVQAADWELDEQGQRIPAEPLPRWFPLQIRHAFGTRMRAAAGIDVVQVLMGHRHRETTEIYALPDATAAIAAILQFG